MSGLARPHRVRVDSMRFAEYSFGQPIFRSYLHLFRSSTHQALKTAGMSLSHSDSALGAFYRRPCSRMDKPRANTANAHKLARMVYFMMTRNEAFVDQGQQQYEEQQCERSVAALGFQINPNSVLA